MKFIITLIIFSAGMLSAQSSNAVLKNIQSKYNSIDNLSADFQQSVSINKSTGAKGKLYFQKEEKYRIEFKNLEIISDGKTLWNYNKRSNKVIINSVKKGNGIFSLKTMIIDFPAESKVESLGKETAGSVRCDVVKLSAVKQGSIKTLKIWADEAGLPRKLEMTDSSDNIMTFELSNIKVDQPISGGRFKFDIPKGSEVIDLR